MTKLAAALGGALLLIAPASGIAAPAAKVAPVTDWSKTVVATPQGGIAMGNPKAKVTLVEYGSLTCSHCRDFALAGMKPLVANYVRTGKVRFEFRSFLLNGYDVAANLIARCNGPRGFFPVADAMFATQDQWLGTASRLPKERTAALEGLPPEKLLPQMASLVGLQKIGAAKGVPVARANQCLANRASADTLIGFAEKARAEGIRGTPTFFLNGRQLGVNTWPTVEAELKAALGR